ncbi:FecCD family ABC transporter permease [Paenibacillus allorhizosphaerae]|uniref:Siderophore transport system permease protein YfhA n=1 Tax=Paenibacillus allorhizosphaerae TaxID=2849866 RepID=A0ABM8VJP5_9BACL|nr:iron ABC transporter permease [Paenibacillus allorhizosphaerae]CAG7645835.1 putative siderophore transport system permease protein YfhA [Paenibacillus allorhizosphaerae]
MKRKQSRYITIRGPRYSFLLNRKTLTVAFLLAIAMAAIFIVSTGIGSVFISPKEVVLSIIGKGSDTSGLIIRSLRLPREVAAILVGASLAVAGAILQGVVRNPLASPDTIGMTGGATLGAVSFFFFFSEKASISWLPVCAIIGAFAASTIVYLLAWKQGGITPLRLVLIGIGFSAATSSLSYMMMISGPIILANQSLTFMTGSIYGVSWEKDVLPLLPWVLILLPLVFLLARQLDNQELGDDVARGVGSRVEKERWILLLLSVALAGAAVAIGGAIGFISLMAPHMARKLVGPAFGGLLPVSALIGAIVLLLADLAGRALIPPLDIPAGVFTAAIGAPFFVYLLYRSRNRT